ncbi:hypothetical protein BDA96_05G177500 [Sorghum bicolor]|uniref:Uncharacterized protein n=2 Tax=Sorghum bicolor TaxID=4558 RepID=A0A921QYK2_SORBI|nr:hypothetical protein BDA96_05G177500 [Sorghum bicolor]OQU83716.1 hypothetical protein SORBI_3005G163450 [Sorghum bicolor]
MMGLHTASNPFLDVCSETVAAARCHQDQSCARDARDDDVAAKSPERDDGDVAAMTRWRCQLC